MSARPYSPSSYARAKNPNPSNMNKIDLDDKVAVVTGGARGIGQAIF